MGIMDNISQNKTSDVREREWVKSGDTVGKRSKEGERNGKSSWTQLHPNGHI